MPLLSALVFSPLAGALLVALLPREREQGLRRAALLLSLLPFALSCAMLALFRAGEGDFQLVERAPWIGAWGAEYHLAVDGVSLFLVLLTTFLTPLVILASWGDIRRRVKDFLVLVLVLETGMLGAFLALDLLLFYVFWELMLVPMYFLIGVWGGPRRVYAALKFVLFTMAGSVLMLVGIIYLAARHQAVAGSFTFDLERLYALGLSPAEQLWLFVAFGLAFAVKVPLFPLHTWLPDAHVEAPTGGSVILAAVLLKMGTYGFLRFAIPLFPAAVASVTPFVALLAVVGIVYGALVAMVQPDLKKLVAYSSVSHLGFVMLGLFALNLQGLAGGLYEMLSHGLATGALFLLVGMIYERRHTRMIAELGGLWRAVPVYAGIFMVIMLASAGLPGLTGFVGEFLILLGAFRSSPALAAVATSGVVLGAVYLLWMYQRVMFGPLDKPENASLTDLSAREVTVLVPIVVMCLVMGLYPRPFLERIEPSLARVLARVPAATAPAVVAEAGR